MKNKNILHNYLHNYIICCCVEGDEYDPTNFQENHPKYKSCFGYVHVKRSTIILATFKLLLLIGILIYKFISSNDELLRLFGLFGFIAACLSNILLIAGVHSKKYVFLIPYFTACILFIFILVLQLFYSFLDTANLKNSLEPDIVIWNLSLLAITIFEVYTLIVVWRVFVYICDYSMDCRLRRINYSTEEATSECNHLFGTTNRITVGNDETDSSEGE
ncbi:unnamed protein product [Auanema sp. JU1783]|nr:unnamed protein product [Auanema sp. JU1783]